MIMRIRLGRQDDRPGAVARLWSPGTERVVTWKKIGYARGYEEDNNEFLEFRGTLYNSFCNCSSHLVYDSVRGVVGFIYI